MSEKLFIPSEIEVQQGGVPFSGFRICHACVNVEKREPQRVSYSEKIRCRCGHGDLSPLLDTEVMYYLAQRMKLTNALVAFGRLLDRGAIVP